MNIASIQLTPLQHKTHASPITTVWDCWFVKRWRATISFYTNYQFVKPLWNLSNFPSCVRVTLCQAPSQDNAWSILLRWLVSDWHRSWSHVGGAVSWPTTRDWSRDWNKLERAHR